MPASKPISLAVALVCIAHFFSHFNMMLLPPLLPVIAEHMQIGYTEIGLALTFYSFLSAITQTPMGFAVDRYGAARILVAGVVLEGLAFGLIGVFPLFAGFVLLLGIAGIANAIYHPANYSILNQVVAGSQIGKAFSYHTAAGLLGEAVAPATILILTGFLGWRVALIICGLAGIMVGVTLAINLKQFVTKATTQATARRSTGLKQLLTLPLIMGLLFFVGITLTTRGVTGFGVSALHVGQNITLGAAGTLLSAWLFAAPLGVLFGGQMADRHDKHAYVISGCFIVVALCLSTLAMFSPAFAPTLVLFGIGGFCAGIVSPSRDMLIRSITPEGQAGKVFGFVSTGFNLGGMLAPPLYGYLLDSGFANGVFWTASLASVLTIVTVVATRKSAHRSVSTN